LCLSSGQHATSLRDKMDEIETTEVPESQQGEDQQPVTSRNMVLLVGGLFLLGMALALLLFGNPFGNDASSKEPADLPQVPAAAAVNPRTGVIDPVVIGDQALDFTLPDVDGNEIALSSLTGKPVIINFWATWCPPCRLEMPELQEAFEAYQDQGLVVLVVNQQEQAEDVRAFFDEMGFTYTPLMDSKGEVGRAYGVVGLPSTFFVDRSGTISAVHRGIISREQIDSYLAEILS
jgi:cytochrome c biogenesis protein CcmG/thiol:disulfide interchange protein DsbE